MRYTLTLLCFTLTATGLGQTTVYDFLRLDRSARIAALGGNSVSLAGDIASFFQNPAVLDSSTHKQASFSFQKHVLDINSGFVAYGRTLPGIGQFGAGISVVSYGNFEETDAVGNTTGSFSAGDFALQIGYAVNLQHFGFGALRAGAALKFIFSSIQAFRSTALALDAGLLLAVPSEALHIGFAVLNLGTQLSGFDGVRENLPLDVRFSLSKKLEGLPLELTVGFIRLADPSDNFFTRFRQFTVGGEFTITEAVKLRIGYSNLQRQDLSLTGTLGLSGFSAGLGIAIEHFRFDYAFSSWGVLGGLHQLTLVTVL
ncbi:MAG: type IX secretion system protein PorQ [Chloroherpetonaceae bacterium]|nr:type IX secretion system protein PorQ [Chloroherpetonaceae bacterium]